MRSTNGEKNHETLAGAMAELGGLAIESRINPRSRAGPGDLADHGFELGEVDRLGQVGGEAGLAAPADVLLHAVAGQGDRRDVAAAGDDPAHQVQAAAVGQADVADDQVEVAGLERLEGRGDRARPW